MGRAELNHAIEEVVSLVRRQVLSGGVSVRMQLAKDLPPARGDRVQLQQVLLNLILNAIEAMVSVDSEMRNLLIRTEAHGGEGLLVSICDSGPGVAFEERERIFESFYSTKADGMGIGLSICRSIIDAHGGRLWVDAHQPCGSAFRFSLPTYN
jgi:C4-dicarboxylate-specific signal transduction histidine kinase